MLVLIYGVYPETAAGVRREQEPCSASASASARGPTNPLAGCPTCPVSGGRASREAMPSLETDDRTDTSPTGLLRRIGHRPQRNCALGTSRFLRVVPFCSHTDMDGTRIDGPPVRACVRAILSRARAPSKISSQTTTFLFSDRITNHSLSDATDSTLTIEIL